MNAFGHFVSTVLLWLSALLGTHVHAIQELPLPVIIAIPPRATILFGGDMMFDRSVRTAIREHGGEYIFSCFGTSTFSSADLVVANLEGPITTHASESEGSAPSTPPNFTFTFATSTATLLKHSGIDIVNIGNNHIENFGTDGERETMQWLAKAGVLYFGDTIEQGIATTTVKGIPIALINYNQFAARSSASTTIEQIAAARAAGDIAIVYTHWGDEYEPATALEKRLAHEFVDAGAEMVIGSHPHVIQEHELYRGKYIYYSLGNMIFDQYWNDAVRSGMLLRVTLEPAGVTRVEEQLVELERDRRTCIKA
jgi:poly-gamma-glutamate synthesis protein (capsule biosynthesis protein)